MINHNLDLGIDCSDYLRKTDVPITLGEVSDYYTYFKALALKANGATEESNALFDEIATNNFFGFQRALVRNLAIAQL